MPLDLQACLLRSASIDAISFLFPAQNFPQIRFAVLGARAFGAGGRNRRAQRYIPLAAAINGGQDHYSVLGVSSHASSDDIKQAFRLLARKYHPDVSKDLNADEMFKSVRLAYEVLSNKAKRAEYDESLRFQQHMSKPWESNWTKDPEFDERLRIYRWAELRQRIWKEKRKKKYSYRKYSRSYHEARMSEETSTDERPPFHEVLWFAFFTLFFMQTLGCRASLTLCGLTVLLDKQLDAGYKLGHLVAWFLGGQGGILLTLCLSFASWLCGKGNSSLVAVVVLAMWVSANLARFLPLPQGAVLTLLYMSIKLQVELR